MKWRRRHSTSTATEAASTRPSPRIVDPVDIAPNDPALAVLGSATGPVDIDELELDSPAIRAMREAGVKMVVPLVAQGELIGLLNLGPRLSEQPYSSDDRRLLASLASQAAPALRVAQLVKEQEEEARRRERVEAELRVAQLIQQNFLPRDVTPPNGWELETFYRPAREVGGDFYDVIELPDGQLGVIVGDVTDKGVPAALVMASTRSILRASAQRLVDPAAVLERANGQLVPDIPEAMFATCLYGVLDPATGSFRFANAGHNLPVVTVGDEVVEPRATGMPLGLLRDSSYDEAEIRIPDGGTLVLYSDALPEAHGPDGDMFGFSGVRRAVADGASEPMVEHLLRQLDSFVGADWEQEDDLTFVVLRRSGITSSDDVGEEPTLLAELTAPSVADSERDVADAVVAAAARAGLPEGDHRRLGTAVAEAVMNAMEHGNGYRENLPVRLRVLGTVNEITVEVRDAGLAGPIPTDHGQPDLDAKIRGDEPTRGWGLFLAASMVDEVHTHTNEEGNVTRLVMKIGQDNG